MMETIGFLELNSIAKGVEAADSVLKAAAVRLLSARAGCPGKYYLLFTGEVAAVQASLEAGERTGEGFVVDSCVIPRVHPQVIEAIAAATAPETLGAVGVMEFRASNVSIFSRIGRLLILRPPSPREISKSAVPRLYSILAWVTFISISIGTVLISIRGYIISISAPLL